MTLAPHASAGVVSDEAPPLQWRRKFEVNQVSVESEACISVEAS